MSASVPQSGPAPRILISRLSAHGDVTQTLPLLADLRRSWPNAHIGWVVEEAAAPLLAGHPWIDRLHVSRRKRWFKAMRNPLKWPETLSDMLGFVRELRAERYEMGLDVQGLMKSAVWLPLAGIPERYGFTATREGAAVFYNRKLPYHDLKNPDRRAVDIFRAFAEACGGRVQAEPEFVIPPVTDAAQERVDMLLRSLHPGWPTVALAPFTRWASKTWPADSWREILRALAGEELNLLLLGAPEDQTALTAMLAGLPQAGVDQQSPDQQALHHQELTQQTLDQQADDQQGRCQGDVDQQAHGEQKRYQTAVDQQAPARILNLAGQTGWPDLYALFEKVDLLVGLDSAPLHIANAVGHSRIIGLFGPTGKYRTGPIGPDHETVATDLDCQPCFERRCPLGHHRCMRELTPAVVLAAVERQLAEIRSSRADRHGVQA